VEGHFLIVKYRESEFLQYRRFLGKETEGKDVLQLEDRE